MTTPTVRVRFAPSPTGELHLGSARTALYNYLFARRTGGTMMLRIEDTDQKRFVPGSMDRFLDDLAWLGIEIDEGPHIQSERAARHREVVEELIRRGFAYYEFGVDEAAGEKRSDEEYRTGRGVYRGHDREQSIADATARVAAGEAYAIRLKVPASGSITVRDAVRGEVSFDLSTVDDAVLLKSDGMATYHLAAMVDDHDMEITHILRSEEWLPSTPKHLLIFQAMGWDAPQFVHLPVVLAADGKKLSKRIHGEAVWIGTYRKQGYLPEALTNYLALLGWNPGGDRELLTRSELVETFSLERIHKAGAKFDQEKLDAFQGHYVRSLSVAELVDELKSFGVSVPDDALLFRLTTVTQSRLVRLADFDGLTAYFHKLPAYDDHQLVFRKSTREATRQGLAAATRTLEVCGNETWESEERLASVLDRVVASEALTNGDVFWPVRVALTGQDRSPSPAECLWVLGRAESLRRLTLGLEKL
ncbi:MAG: glutamate--tRNA ligase [Patescibacteria group bacterium]|jgi:glutamyl-tRNA synthetase